LLKGDPSQKVRNRKKIVKAVKKALTMMTIMKMRRILKSLRRGGAEGKERRRKRIKLQHSLFKQLVVGSLKQL